MIAPIRPTESSDSSTSSLAPARRAVAEFFFRDAKVYESRAPLVSRLAAWIFCGWALAMVVSYLNRGGWWNRGS